MNPTQNRFEHLATQLKWRLQEGRGEAVYQIGVEDNGLLVGLSQADMTASIGTLRKMADKYDAQAHSRGARGQKSDSMLLVFRVGADITLLRERQVDSDVDGSARRIAEVLVRKVPDDQQVRVRSGREPPPPLSPRVTPPGAVAQFLDLRVAVLGNVDSGKSTLLGVLTQGELDNGRGRARLNLFRHLHEIQTGRTSSISFEILGFDSRGQVSGVGSVDRSMARAPSGPA